MNPQGRLIFVVGPSGAGKDSVMAWAREHAGELPVAFAHRYITRPPEAGGENHVQLTPREFTRRKDAGLFALAWAANGHDYGIGIEIETWLECGLTVVANGSRGYLPQALERHPQMLPVLVTAPPEILARRLAARGRETSQEILARLKRASTLDPGTDIAATIVNDGPLERAGQALLDVIAARV